jgi:predicted transcriptional regulator
MKNNFKISSMENNFEKKIFELLDKDLMSTSQLARELGMRRDMAAGYLEALRNQGKLNFFKVGRSYVYTIPKRRKNE